MQVYKHSLWCQSNPYIYRKKIEYLHVNVSIYSICYPYNQVKLQNTIKICPVKTIHDLQSSYNLQCISYPSSESKSDSGLARRMSVGSDNTSSSGSPLSNSFILYTITTVPVLPSILSNWAKNSSSVLKGEYFSMISISNLCCRRKRREKVNKICPSSSSFIYHMSYIYLIHSKYFKIIYKKICLYKEHFLFSYMQLPFLWLLHLLQVYSLYLFQRKE